jgi:hypothetical protein
VAQATDRKPALHARSPEFKFQSHKKSPSQIFYSSNQLALLPELLEIPAKIACMDCCALLGEKPIQSFYLKTILVGLEE